MITENGVLKLLDFGVARENMGYTCQYSDSRVGTNSHKAPELFGPVPDNEHKSLANYRADLWSLGIVLQNIITLELPFGINEKELERRIIDGFYDEIEEPEELRKLIASLLQRDPNKRPTYREIKQDPYLKPYFDAYEVKK